jgi:hypothetical protein
LYNLANRFAFSQMHSRVHRLFILGGAFNALSSEAQRMSQSHLSRLAGAAAPPSKAYYRSNARCTQITLADTVPIFAGSEALRRGFETSCKLPTITRP